MRATTAILAMVAVAAAMPAAAAERSFVLSAFESIQVEGDVDVTLRSAASPSAKATGAQVDLDRVRFERNGTALVVRLERPNSGSNARRSGKVSIALATRRLDTVLMRGNSALAIDSLKAQQIRITLLGSGSVAVGSVSTDRLTIGLDGSGKLAIGGGKAGIVRIEQRGAGTVDAPAVTAQTLDIVHNGLATTRIAATGRATLVSNGSGLIEVGGTPDCQLRDTGTATVRCGAAR